MNILIDSGNIIGAQYLFITTAQFLFKIPSYIINKTFMFHLTAWLMTLQSNPLHSKWTVNIVNVSSSAISTQARTIHLSQRRGTSPVIPGWGGAGTLGSLCYSSLLGQPDGPLAHRLCSELISTGYPPSATLSEHLLNIRVEDAALSLKGLLSQEVRQASTALVLTIHPVLGSQTKHTPGHQLAGEQPGLMRKEADMVLGRLQRGGTHDLGLEGREDSNHIESS